MVPSSFVLDRSDIRVSVVFRQLPLFKLGDVSTVRFVCDYEDAILLGSNARVVLDLRYDDRCTGAGEGGR